MADLDAELLALAGGDSSEEEDTKPTTTKVESPNSSVSSPIDNVKSISTSRLGVAQKKTTSSNSRGGTKKSTKRGRKEDSEEGEA